MDSTITALALTGSFTWLSPHDNRAGPLSAVRYDVLGEAVVVGENNGDNRPLRAWPYSKLGCTGSDRRMAGTGAKKADNCGVVSRIHRSVATDRIWACIFRMGTSPGVP